jgi:hypothetical protein
MLDYPEVEHDDLIDSLASHIIITRPSSPDDEKFVDDDDWYDKDGKSEIEDPRVKMGCFAGGTAATSCLAKRA